ncbi:MAG: GAF domain-containing protein [Acidobacteria bacterium]|nr:GAF domain-containing protein [Acidobacteriota bacterium]
MGTSEEILGQVEALIKRAGAECLQDICAMLQRERPHYNWVGIYFLEGSELVLGPFVGAPSPHTRIPIGRGICGAAVRERQTVVVPDVNADPRYLACSLETKSEIVVLIEFDGRILGEIDIDSHSPNAFGPDDRTLLEEVARLLAPRLAEKAKIEKGK